MAHEHSQQFFFCFVLKYIKDTRENSLSHSGLRHMTYMWSVQDVQSSSEELSKLITSSSQCDASSVFWLGHVLEILFKSLFSCAYVRDAQYQSELSINPLASNK